jgi:hypothetical protein
MYETSLIIQFLHDRCSVFPITARKILDRAPEAFTTHQAWNAFLYEHTGQSRIGGKHFLDPGILGDYHTTLYAKSHCNQVRNGTSKSCVKPANIYNCWIMIFIIILACIAMILVYIWISHYISIAHKRYLHRKNNWDLNICCGKTDIGKTNADIIKHAEVKNFQLIEDIYKLPFVDKQFDTVLCSHTMEHVDCPDRFFEELKRVGKSVTIILPPLYDISAALNFIEHKWIFLTFRRTYIDRLPKRVKLPGTGWLHRRFGQVKKG